MAGSPLETDNTALLRKSTEVAVRLIVVGLLVYWCFLIFKPFLIPLVWGIILAVALRPAWVRVERALGGRRKLTAAVVLVIALATLFVPTLLLSRSLVDGVRYLSSGVHEGNITIPPAPEKVAAWPLVGKPLYDTWSLAATNLEAALQKFRPQVGALGMWLVATAKQAAVAVLMTAVALVIAAVLLMRREKATAAARKVGARLAGERGNEFVDFAGSAIATVAKGVVGVAAIQATLAAVGLLLAGVPGAGLWALLVLIVAVAQLPPLLILAPAIFYVVATSDSTLTIVLFTVWCLIVSFSDAVLKPLLMGRGSNVPVAVILVGAIGGLVLHGVIGLFVGAVVFSIGYRLLTEWTSQASQVTDSPPGATSSRG